MSLLHNPHRVSKILHMWTRFFSQFYILKNFVRSGITKQWLSHSLSCKLSITYLWTTDPQQPIFNKKNKKKSVLIWNVFPPFPSALIGHLPHQIHFQGFVLWWRLLTFLMYVCDVLGQPATYKRWNVFRLSSACLSLVFIHYPHTFFRQHTLLGNVLAEYQNVSLTLPQTDYILLYVRQSGW